MERWWIALSHLYHDLWSFDFKPSFVISNTRHHTLFYFTPAHNIKYETMKKSIPTMLQGVASRPDPELQSAPSQKWRSLQSSPEQKQVLMELYWSPVLKITPGGNPSKCQIKKKIKWKVHQKYHPHIHSWYSSLHNPNCILELIRLQGLKYFITERGTWSRIYYLQRLWHSCWLQEDMSCSQACRELGFHGHCQDQSNSEGLWRLKKTENINYHLFKAPSRLNKRDSHNNI